MRLKSKLLKSVVAVACMGLTAITASAFEGRIAVTADGNIHDPDDFGATPATLAMLAKEGLQAQLVHYDYSSHIGTHDSESTTSGEEEMTESALGGQSRWGFNRSVFFDDTKELQASIDNIAKVVNASSESDPLYFILAGPAEVLWRGLNAADASKRQYVTVISHSWWNEFHYDDVHGGQPEHGTSDGSHTELSKTIDDIEDLGAGFVRIDNQNDYFNTDGDWSRLYWMRDHSDVNIQWMYERIQAVGRPDFSDSGMAWYLITGDENGTVEEFADFIGDEGIIVPVAGAPIGELISLKAEGNGMYVCADKGLDADNSRLYANRETVGAWEKFSVEDAGDGYVAFKANSNGNYIRTDGGLNSTTWPVAANLTTIGDWAKFTWVENSDGTISLKAKGNDNYVCADKGLDDEEWPLVANRTTIGGWEKFTWKAE